ncbi:MAG: methionyl-tRNA formyltransferase [Parachlamydiales bacterium]|nr:methionyl-tRNA formyltransferase [Parachlamydiales bacterium]
MFSVVFFGSPPFAAHVLEDLLEKKVRVIAVVTQPDRITGKRVQKSAVKQLVEQKHPFIPILQPEKASQSEFLLQLQQFSADIFIIVAYGQILKQTLLDIPKVESLNVHLSLLPKYRGAAPLQRAVMDGEKEIGITIMKVVLALDAGDILKTKKIAIQPDATAGDLFAEMERWAAPLLIEVMRELQNNTAVYSPQEEAEATYAKKISKEECRIDWHQSAESIHNQVRALSPSPGAYSEIMLGEERKRVKILRTKILDFSLPERQWASVSKNLFAIGTKTCALELVLLQMEGKKVLSSREFFAGLKQPITFR